MKLFRHISGLACLMLMAIALCSCFSDNESESITTNYDNAIVTEFSLEDNSDVSSTSLSGFTFTIDNFGLSDDSIHSRFPNDGIIFNPDSLPVGTIPDSVQVSVSYSSPDSVVFKLYNLDGTLGQYTHFSEDSALYFASYPDCRLTLYTYGGSTKTYHIKINVHKVKGDTIVWHDYTNELWADMDIADQRVDTLGDKLCWFVESKDGHDFISTSTISTVSNSSNWQDMAMVNVEGGDLLDLSTLYNWHNALYALGKIDGKLLSSTDGYNWDVVSDGYTFQAILGNQYKTKDVYGKWNKDSLNAIVKVNGEYHFATSADARQWNVAQTIQKEFPIKGFTRPIYTEARSDYGNLTSRIYIVGGEMADGTYSSSTWSCDGWDSTDKGPNWEEFPQDELPAMCGASVLEYTIDSDYPRTFWLLSPGFKMDGTVPSHKLYSKLYTTMFYSQDHGVSWHRLSRYYTQYADNTPVDRVACNSAFFNTKNYQMYFFGGKREDGTFKTAIWGGVLNSLTFEKLR